MFGWVHWTSAFQMVTDAIAHNMRKHRCQLFPYIADFTRVVEANKDESHFRF